EPDGRCPAHLPGTAPPGAGETPVAPTELAREFGFLVITKGRRVGSLFRLERPRTLIGRSSRVQIHLDDPRVAGEHASIRCERIPGAVRPEFVLRDLDSETGTFVNGERITALRVLVDGDRIGAGETELVFKRV
ncbi:MAG: FHA domain-containing protein, partial [Bacteroidota bacterium]